MPIPSIHVLSSPAHLFFSPENILIFFLPILLYQLCSSSFMHANPLCYFKPSLLSPKSNSINKFILQNSRLPNNSNGVCRAEDSKACIIMFQKAPRALCQPSGCSQECHWTPQLEWLVSLSQTIHILCRNLRRNILLACYNSFAFSSLFWQLVDMLYN